VRALETARREGRFVAEGWRVRKDGQRFRASVVIDAIRDDEGVPTGFATITRDITEREEAQQQLEQAREALFQSQKMDAIGQLTGGIAHDFYNLLMAVLGSLDLLRKRLPEDPLAQRLLNNALQGAQRGATLTQRMLAFTRRQELKVDRVDLPYLLENMNDLVQRSIGPEWPISTTFPLKIPDVRADANQLEMALLNLIVNARDATLGGGPIRSAQSARISAPASPGRRPPVVMSDWSSPIAALAWTPIRCVARPNPSSRPRAWAREPAWGSLWCMAWPRRSAARSSCRAKRGGVPARSCGFPWPGRSQSRPLYCPKTSSFRPRSSGSLRSMTMRSSFSIPRRCWRTWDIRSSRRVRSTKRSIILVTAIISTW
jgi:hypothetical protein